MPENVNANAIAALREAADWLAQHPELPPVFMGNIAVFAVWDRDLKADVAVVARAMGDAKKDYSDTDFFLIKEFGGGAANITWCGKRETVCEKVQTGTKVVPATKKQIIPALPEREVPVYEWHCGSVLAPAQEGGE